MEWEWKIRITDIIIIFAIVLGSIIAVQITEYLRSTKDARNRKVHIFRNLMATRSAQLAAMHIEALNLVELEFQSKERIQGQTFILHKTMGGHRYPPLQPM